MNLKRKIDDRHTVNTLKSSGNVSDKKVSLWFLFLVFVKIGCIVFGGFTALIAVVEAEMIRKRNLLSTRDMLTGSR